MTLMRTIRASLCLQGPDEYVFQEEHVDSFCLISASLELISTDKYTEENYPFLQAHIVLSVKLVFFPGLSLGAFLNLQT